jgi:hypothetical protein
VVGPCARCVIGRDDQELLDAVVPHPESDDRIVCGASKTGRALAQRGHRWLGTAAIVARGGGVRQVGCRLGHAAKGWVSMLLSCVL